MSQQNEPNSTSQRRLAAVLFADITGYTALMQTDEKQALASLQKFKQELETHVPPHRGEIIQFYGDGCLTVFNSSADAAACAMVLQQSFQSEPRVPVRIGLHAGDITFRDGNAYGDAVNIASRVESMGIQQEGRFQRIVAEHEEQIRRFRNALKSMEADGQMVFSVED